MADEIVKEATRAKEFLLDAGGTLLFLGGVIIFYKGLEWIFSLV